MLGCASLKLAAGAVLDVQSAMADSLRSTSNIAAPNPFARLVPWNMREKQSCDDRCSRLFSGAARGKETPMLEIDGAKTRDFFTVLSIGRLLRDAVPVIHRRSQILLAGAAHEHARVLGSAYVD